MKWVRTHDGYEVTLAGGITLTETWTEFAVDADATAAATAAVAVGVPVHVTAVDPTVTIPDPGPDPYARLSDLEALEVEGADPLPLVADALSDDASDVAQGVDGRIAIGTAARLAAVDADPSSAFRIQQDGRLAAQVDSVAGASMVAVDANPASAFRVQQDARLVAGRPIHAWAYGVRTGTGTDQSAALALAFAAAEALGGGAHVVLPPGVITIAGGFSLAGYSSGIIGHGSSAGASFGATTGTVIRCIAQTGPVLDFTGFLYPNAQRGRAIFADFAVEGDGTAGTTKKGVYLYAGEASSSTSWRNVTIGKTGGVPLHVKDHYLSDFHGVTVTTPVSVAANDVPYVLLEGASGSRFFGLGIRSTVFDGTADCGVSGAVRMLMGAVYQQHRSLFSGMWFENMHVPSNGSLVVTQTNAVTFSDTQHFDCFKVAGATSTTHFRLESPATSNLGGNIIRGVIPGQGTNADDIDRGVIVQQSGNRIEGSKGYRGNHVQLDAGVEYTHVSLGGALGAANTAAWINNSGNLTNDLHDHAQGLHEWGGRNASNVRHRMLGVDMGDKLTTFATQTGSWAVNLSGGANAFIVPLGGATTMTGFTGFTAGTEQVGRRVTLILKQDATGSRTVSWHSSVRFAGNTAPTLSPAANAVDVLTFLYDGTVWREQSRSLGQAA